MAINFPNSPQLDDTYTEGNRSWRWNGVYWRATSATVGYTGSKGDQGESFRILGSVATVNDLPADSSGLPGDGYIIIDTGDLYVWDGFNWNNIYTFSCSKHQRCPTTSTSLSISNLLNSKP